MEIIQNEIHYDTKERVFCTPFEYDISIEKLLYEISVSIEKINYKVLKLSLRHYFK